MTIRRHIARLSLLAALCCTAACGGDEMEPDTTCAAGLDYDPIAGECVRLADPNNDDNPPTEDGGGADVPDAGGDERDAGADVDDVGMADTGTDCTTDSDGDGAIAMECGGNDCDDSDARRAPGAAELCDEVDNDCDGENNEGIECSIYAHSSTDLYRVDLFDGTIENLGPTVENLWDIDTHPDGTLYGVAGNRVYTYDPNSGDWTARPGQLGTVAESPNGFCIDNDGTAYMTSGITQRLLLVDLVAGTATAIGSTTPARSSGDCVVNKGNVLFMTSGGPDDFDDDFVKLDGTTGTSMNVGPTGFDAIWALTAAYSRVFGMTEGGDVVEIDVGTGAAMLINSFPNISFYGAASTPER